MGENGRKFVEENFNWNKIAREFLDILESREVHR
jgi:glycosyltransferase involved in cell wall biosynthesis